MDLILLLSDTSLRLSKEEIASIAGNNDETFASLADLAFTGEMPICWRATWLMDYLAEQNPRLADQYIQSFWEEVPREHPTGVLRSLLRLLTRYNIPEDYHGIATDLCLDWLEQVKVAVAIKVYAMEMLLKIAIIYPELKNEFKLIIEAHIPYNSVAYKARAKHILKAMNSISG